MSELDSIVVEYTQINLKRVVMKRKVGDLAPDFTLNSHLDKEVTLSEYRGKTTVMVFFPLAFTPV